MTEQLHFHFSPSCIGEGNGNPLQCSYLENPRDGEPGGLPFMGSHRVGHDWSNLAAAAAVHRFGEGNGNPLQYSCLENSVDRGAWWAAVHGVTQSQTWLKRLSMHACIGEGNSNPLQYSCLVNPRDGGAWWGLWGRTVEHDWSDLAAAAAAVHRFITEGAFHGKF